MVSELSAQPLIRDMRASEGVSRRFAISCLTVEAPGTCEESSVLDQLQQVRLSIEDSIEDNILYSLFQLFICYFKAEASYFLDGEF